MRRLKIASEKVPPDGVMTFMNEEPCTARMKLVDSRNKKVSEELSIPNHVPSVDYGKAGIDNWIERHKRNTRSIDQDSIRPAVMPYFIAEVTFQLKAHQKKGT